MSRYKTRCVICSTYWNFFEVGETRSRKGSHPTIVDLLSYTLRKSRSEGPTKVRGQTTTSYHNGGGRVEGIRDQDRGHGARLSPTLDVKDRTIKRITCVTSCSFDSKNNDVLSYLRRIPLSSKSLRIRGHLGVSTGTSKRDGESL